MKREEKKRKNKNDLDSIENSYCASLFVPSAMDTNDTSDVILASMLNVNIAEVSKIPPDLRIVLISKFESMRNEIDLKRDDIQDRKL